jgi:nitroreductase
VETYEAIMTRRSVPQLEGSPSREAVERLLRAAVRAPTHHLTQPWRFVVLTGDARGELGDTWAAGVAGRGQDPAGVRAKCFRAPVIICIIERPKTHLPKVVDIEEHHATGAAMQNMLLAAHDCGLGAMLRTGPAATLPEVRAYLGVTEDEIIAGFIYLGYPPQGDELRPMTRRSDPDDVTEWRGWK